MDKTETGRDVGTSTAIIEKPWWLFVIADYYPSGGMGDYEGEFSTFEETFHSLQDYTSDRAQIINICTDDFFDYVYHYTSEHGVLGWSLDE